MEKVKGIVLVGLEMSSENFMVRLLAHRACRSTRKVDDVGWAVVGRDVTELGGRCCNDGSMRMVTKLVLFC